MSVETTMATLSNDHGLAPTTIAGLMADFIDGYGLSEAFETYAVERAEFDGYELADEEEEDLEELDDEDDEYEEDDYDDEDEEDDYDDEEDDDLDDLDDDDDLDEADDDWDEDELEGGP